MDTETERIVNQIMGFYNDEDTAPYYAHSIHRCRRGEFTLILGSGEEYVIEVRKVEGV